jgi:hypothetical protein
MKNNIAEGNVLKFSGAGSNKYIQNVLKFNGAVIKMAFHNV